MAMKGRKTLYLTVIIVGLIAWGVREESNGKNPATKSEPTTGAAKTELKASNRPMIDADVALIQRALKNKGYDPGPVDGLMGEKTRTALRNYQTIMNLKPTGQVTDEVRSKLIVGDNRRIEAEKVRDQNKKNAEGACLIMGLYIKQRLRRDWGSSRGFKKNGCIPEHVSAVADQVYRVSSLYETTIGTVYYTARLTKAREGGKWSVECYKVDIGGECLE